MARSRQNKRMPLLPVTPASHHCGEAVAEFHKVIDYPGIVVNEPSVHYLISNSDEPTANPVTPPRRKPHTETSLRSGKTGLRHPHPDASQGGVRETAIAAYGLFR